MTTLRETYPNVLTSIAVVTSNEHKQCVEAVLLTNGTVIVGLVPTLTAVQAATFGRLLSEMVEAGQKAAELQTVFDAIWKGGAA